MRHLHVGLLSVLFALSSFAQTTASREDSKAAQVPSAATTKQDAAIELLQRTETEAAALDGRMRAWVLWQLGIAYQPSNKSKALELFKSALTSARTIREDGSSEKAKKDPMMRLTGRPSLTPGLRLQADIARSLVLLDPRHAGEAVQQVDPAVRTTVLTYLLASQEKESHFDQALETLNLIIVQDEMPYPYAMRLMEHYKPEQSAELTRLFLSALASYRDHAPHPQFTDQFSVMLARYWKRLPKEVATEGIDEILKQAAGLDEKGSYSVQSEKETATFGSLYEYRLSQIMPAIRELEPAAARSFQEKYPALPSFPESSGSSSASTSNAVSFYPTGSYASVMLSAAESPTAQKVAAQADSGHADEAIANAAGIVDLDLRTRTYEYIARVAAKDQSSVAADAIKNMLETAQKLEPRDGFRFYISAAEIYVQMGQPDDARKSIETGLALADKLYLADSDDDDPNTALKAFWPSTNAYCALLRQAARISPVWAISLLQGIKDPEVRVATETALLGGWLNAPISPSTIMTTKKTSNSFSTNSRD